MRRKRFVKLLMAMGVQRNEANLLALLMQERLHQHSEQSVWIAVPAAKQ